MRSLYISLLFVCALYQGAFCIQILSQQSDEEPVFTKLTVKKKNGGRICDTCKIDFVHSSDADLSYVIIGSGPTPSRLSHLRDSVGRYYLDAGKYNSQTHIISGADFNFSFLPNFIEKKGKRIPLYGNYSGTDYNQLEFLTIHNGKPIHLWTKINTLGEIKDFTVFGSKRGSGKTSDVPWNQTFFAGNFHLAVKDTLAFLVRNIITKNIVQAICIFRAEDKATSFVYYQVPLASKRFNVNIQNILNISEVPLKVFRGDTVNVFEKDYSSLGILRFIGMDRNEQLQYSFKTAPYSWQTISSINSENGIFLVLDNDMEAGTDHDIYLRFKTQPETIHKITIKVKQKPSDIPWRNIAAISVILLAAAGVSFYLWHIRSKRKLNKLKQKNEDIEMRLALLSGQLNPHFLFNSLNAIQGTINSGDPEKTNDYIGNVAGFMRDVMDNCRKEFISLQEELKMEADYLKLENERKQFSYTLDIVGELEATLIDIPPLLLQPVLENSIRHAFTPDHPDPTLSIKVSRAMYDLIIKVADNGRTDWNTCGFQYGHGLSLTRKRIAVYNEKLEGMSVQMEIKYLQGSGTITIFTLKDWLA